jgi:hypothetical protein
VVAILSRVFPDEILFTGFTASFWGVCYSCMFLCRRMQPLNTTRRHKLMLTAHYFMVTTFPVIFWFILPNEDEALAPTVVGSIMWVFTSGASYCLDELLMTSLRDLPEREIQTYLQSVLLPSFTSMIPMAYSAMPLIECIAEVCNDEGTSEGRREKFILECGIRSTSSLYLNSWLLLLMVTRVAILPLTMTEGDLTTTKIMSMQGLKRRYVYHAIALIIILLEALYYLARTESIGKVHTFDQFFGFTGTLLILSIMAVEVRTFIVERSDRKISMAQRKARERIFMTGVSSGSSGPSWNDML